MSQNGVAVLGVFVVDLAFRAGNLPAIGETIADANEPEALPVLEVEAPTLKIYLGPNTSPFKGTEGEFTTSRQIGEGLCRKGRACGQA